MPAHRSPYRAPILARFRRGEFASVAEAVTVTGFSRQVLWKWLRRAGIDIAAARQSYLAGLHSRIEREVDGKPLRKPSKAAMRREAEIAVRKFNEANK